MPFAARKRTAVRPGIRRCFTAPACSTGPMMQGVKSVERAGAQRHQRHADYASRGRSVQRQRASGFCFRSDPAGCRGPGGGLLVLGSDRERHGSVPVPRGFVSTFSNPRRPPEPNWNAACCGRYESDMVVHSDIEVLDRAGKVYYRLLGWETRRFPQPPRFLHCAFRPAIPMFPLPGRSRCRFGRRNAGCVPQD